MTAEPTSAKGHVRRAHVDLGGPPPGGRRLRRGHARRRSAAEREQRMFTAASIWDGLHPRAAAQLAMNIPWLVGRAVADWCTQEAEAAIEAAGADQP